VRTGTGAAGTRANTGLQLRGRPLLALPRLVDDLVAVLDDRNVLHVRSVDSHDGVHTLPERLLLLADSCSSVSPRPWMSHTDTLGSLPPPAVAVLTLTEPLSSALRLGSQERLPDKEELRSATVSTMDCALETQACSIKDGGIPGVAAAGVLVLDVLEHILVGVLVEVTRHADTQRDRQPDLGWAFSAMMLTVRIAVVVLDEGALVSEAFSF
jgi:hypothetical protein